MTNSTKKSGAPFISLEMKGRYKDFEDFYDENKRKIYTAIFDIFKEFKTTRKKSLSLVVSAKIQGLDWNTEFTFHKEESIVLKRDLMPYFEQIEDYEICQEINNLYKDLTILK